MILKRMLPGAIFLLIAPFCFSQLTWTKVDSLFGPLPASMHVYKTSDPVDGKPNIAYYASAELKDMSIDFTAEAEDRKRLTPAQYYQQFQTPVLVVNCTFFNTTTGQNLNTVVKDKKPLAFNESSKPGRGKDSIIRYRVFKSAIGISGDRKADVAWLSSDSVSGTIKAAQHTVGPIADPVNRKEKNALRKFKKWNMVTAVGGGPVLVQKSDTLIANNQEMMFAGKARYDKHPRTAMGYTSDGKIIVLVVQGRFPGIAEGLDLQQEALMLKDLGCYEALNLDGGGSTCMLINGKETIKPSDKAGQRAVPAVFMIKRK